MNAEGQLIGLTSFVLKDSEGLAFAMPVEYAYERFAAVLASGADEDTGAFSAWKQAMRGN
jgi:S1-C subfamily serine protease